MVVIGPIAAKADPDNAVLYLLSWLCVIIIFTIASADLMGDYMVALRTRTSPNAMYLGQGLGMLAGCLIVPGIWSLWMTAFPDYYFPSSSMAPAPYAASYRLLAQIGSEGFSSLPSHSKNIFWTTFGIFLAIDFGKWGVLKVIKYVVKNKFLERLVEDWWPNGMMMALCAYSIGPFQWFAFFIGWMIREVFDWKIRKQNSEDEKEAIRLDRALVASALIIGPGIWTIIQTFLALGKVEGGPLCMNIAGGTPEQVAWWSNSSNTHSTFYFWN